MCIADIGYCDKLFLAGGLSASKFDSANARVLF